MRSWFSILYLSTLCCGSVVAAPFAPRQIHTAGAYVIEHDPADTDYVRALTLQLESHPASDADGAIAPFTLADLQKQRADVLRQIAGFLGATEASPEVAKMYDDYVGAMSVLQQTMVNGTPRRFALWRKPDLIARLRAGQQIPGFALDGDDVVIGLNVSFDTDPDLPPGELAARIDKAWDELVWPVKIGDQSPEADVRASLETLRNYKRSLMGNEPWLVMGTLHEAVEFALVTEVIRSADRRWFCEGMANYIAQEIIRERVGADAARPYYDGDALLALAPPAAKQGDLAKWPVGEDAASRHVPGAINEINYLRSTRIIESVVTKHGRELLPKWFAEIRKMPHAKRDMNTVYAAYQTVTGDDLRKILAAH
jgi:hypothetical protein